MDRDIVRWPAFTRRGWIVKCSRNSGVFSLSFVLGAVMKSMQQRRSFKLLLEFAFHVHVALELYWNQKRRTMGTLEE